MTRFNYRALDAQQTLQTGQIEADDREQAVLSLQGNGWLLLSVRHASAFAPGSFRRPVLRPSELANITQQLATLLEAGQPLEQAVTTVSRQQSRQPARLLLERVRANLKSGKSLSKSLELEQAQFPPLYLSMVDAGESGGSLQQTLAQLADYLERSHRLRSSVINALIYPAFLLSGVLGSLCLLLVFVIPQFIPVFNDLGVALPLPTRIILDAGGFSSRHGVAMLALAMFALLAMSSLHRSTGVRRRIDLRLLSTPLLGPLLRHAEAVRICRTLGTLLHNGVGLIQSLHIVARLSPNLALQEQMRTAAERVKEGSTLSAALESPRLLPDLALDMIGVGEASGQLAQLLQKVAEIFEHETRRSIDRLLASFTPILTVAMAVLVMGIMLAIMLPMMSLTNNI